MKHTEEPWEAVARGSRVTIEAVKKERGMRACGDTYPRIANMAASCATDDANAMRIVACVNACAGIEDPEKLRGQIDLYEGPLRGEQDDCQLQRKQKNGNWERAEDFRRQRDTLITLLSPFAAMHCKDEACRCHNCNAHNFISKCKGAT